jgi:hypothetical protein
MSRIVAILASAAMVMVVGLVVVQNLPAGGETAAGRSPPLTYELQINGETFLVEANRETTLESKRKPGVRYRVALRVSPTQRVRLNSIVFDYDLPAKVELDANRDGGTVRITHELGFSVLLGDLGHPLSKKEQEEALKVLVDSVTATLREMKAEGVNVTEPHERKFAGSAARGATIRYTDAKGLGHVYLLYVLSGPKHAATWVVEYLENDADDVLPLIRKMLDSVAAAPERR